MDIREIAQRAEVSISTVSRVINRVPTVDPRLAKRVLKVVDEVGYYPNTQARALVSGRSRTLGLIVLEITNPFFSEIVQTFESLAVEDNYEILLTSIVHDPKQMELSVRRMIERRVDGVAILTLGMEESLLEHLRFRNVPLVFVDVGSDVPRGANIRINYRNGIRQAVQHLAALRHTHIAFVAGPRHLKSACSRRQAFEESMREAGLSPKLIVQGDHTVEGGMRGLENILQLPCNPTATMCSNDLTAIGVMQKAYSLDIRVPADLSVIGFDDIRLAQFVIPPLTTVQMSQTELATTAFRALMNEVTSDQAAHHRSEYRLDTGLLRRRTTAMAAPSQRAAEAKERRCSASGRQSGLRLRILSPRQCRAINTTNSGPERTPGL